MKKAQTETATGVKILITFILLIIFFIAAYYIFTGGGKSLVASFNEQVLARIGIKIEQPKLPGLTLSHEQIIPKITIMPEHYCNDRNITLSVLNSKLPKNMDFSDISVTWDLDLEMDCFKEGISYCNDGNNTNDIDAEGLIINKNVSDILGILEIKKISATLETPGGFKYTATSEIIVNCSSCIDLNVTDYFQYSLKEEAINQNPVALIIYFNFNKSKIDIFNEYLPMLFKLLSCSTYYDKECRTWIEVGNYMLFYNVSYPFLLEINYNDETKAAFPIKKDDYVKFSSKKNNKDYIDENYLLNLSGYICFNRSY